MDLLIFKDKLGHRYLIQETTKQHYIFRAQFETLVLGNPRSCKDCSTNTSYNNYLHKTLTAWIIILTKISLNLSRMFFPFSASSLYYPVEKIENIILNVILDMMLKIFDV